MGNRFLHTGFTFVIEPELDKLENTFDKAFDWYRYAPNCWVVWTSSSPQKWYSRLKRHLGEDDLVFICELDVSNRSGWMPKKFWNFIKSHQGAVSLPYTGVRQ